MYMVIVYDVSQERVSKLCQFLRQHLNWIQNSVFEGEVSESGIERIKSGIKGIIKRDEDSVIIYTTSSKKLVKKNVIGIEKNMLSNVI